MVQTISNNRALPGPVTHVDSVLYGLSQEDGKSGYYSALPGKYVIYVYFNTL